MFLEWSPDTNLKQANSFLHIKSQHFYNYWWKFKNFMRKKNFAKLSFRWDQPPISSFIRSETMAWQRWSSKSDLIKNGPIFSCCLQSALISKRIKLQIAACARSTPFFQTMKMVLRLFNFDQYLVRYFYEVLCFIYDQGFNDIASLTKSSS